MFLSNLKERSAKGIGFCMRYSNGQENDTKPCEATCSRSARFRCFFGLSLPRETVQNNFSVSTVTFSKPLIENVSSHHRILSMGSFISSGPSCPAAAPTIVAREESQRSTEQTSAQQTNQSQREPPTLSLILGVQVMSHLDLLRKPWSRLCLSKQRRHPEHGLPWW